MIAVAKTKATKMGIDNIDFQVGDGYKLPYEDGSFDVILIFNALHIVKEPKIILEEAFRLLKKGGCLAAATDCYAEPVPFKPGVRLLLISIMKLLGLIKYVSFFQKCQVIDLLNESGFKIMEDGILHSAPVNYYVLACK